jgi:hypothetical protein
VSFLTGVWSLVLGLVLIVVAAALALTLRSGAAGSVRVRWLFAFCWVVSVVSVVLAVFMLAVARFVLPLAVQVGRFGRPTSGPSAVRWGLLVVLVASVLAVAATTVASFGRRRTASVPKR